MFLDVEFIQCLNLLSATTSKHLNILSEIFKFIKLIKPLMIIYVYILSYFIILKLNLNSK